MIGEKIWFCRFINSRPTSATAMEPPVPTRAGKVLRFAIGIVLLLKSKTKSSSLGRSWYRSAALIFFIRYVMNNGNLSIQLVLTYPR